MGIDSATKYPGEETSCMRSSCTWNYLRFENNYCISLTQNGTVKQEWWVHVECFTLLRTKRLLLCSDENLLRVCNEEKWRSGRLWKLQIGKERNIFSCYAIKTYHKQLGLWLGVRHHSVHGKALDSQFWEPGFESQMWWLLLPQCS